MRLLDQRQHVAHTENPRCIRSGGTLEPVDLFRDASELDRRAGHMTHRKCAPAAASPSSLVRITPVSGNAVAKCPRRIDGILSLHRVDDDSVSIGLSARADRRFPSSLFVDRETARRIDDQHVVVMTTCIGERVCAIATGAPPSTTERKSAPNCVAKVAAARSRRPVDVGDYEQHFFFCSF